MRSQLFFSWLAVASVVTAQTTKFTDDSADEAAVRRTLATGDDSFNDQEIDTTLDGYDHESVARDLRENRKAKRAPLAVRNALADEAINMIHEYGQDVDVSLEGYDHDAVVRDVEEGPLENAEHGLGFEAAKRLGRMKPHYVQQKAWDEDDDAENDEDGDEDSDEEDDGPWVDLDSYDERDVATRDTDDDYAEGNGLEDEGDTPLVSLERDVDDGETNSPEDIDYSLEGYDNPLGDRDSAEYYDPDEAFHAGAYDYGDAELGSEGQDEELDTDEEERVIQKGPPTQRRRDVADEDHNEEEEDGALSNAWSTVRRWIDDMMNG